MSAKIAKELGVAKELLVGVGSEDTSVGGKREMRMRFLWMGRKAKAKNAPQALAKATAATLKLPKKSVTVEAAEAAVVAPTELSLSLDGAAARGIAGPGAHLGLQRT